MRVTTTLETYRRRPEIHEPNDWAPTLLGMIGDLGSRWERDWRYVIFGAGAVGEQFGLFFGAANELDDLLRHDPIDHASVIDALAKLRDRANDLHSVIQTARYQAPKWRD